MKVRKVGEDEERWTKLHRLIVVFSWAQVGALLWGIFLAHIFYFLGRHWSTCSSTACVLSVHLFEVPIALYLAGVAVFGLRKISRALLRRYSLMIHLAIVAMAVFLVFEISLLIGGINKNAPPIESWGLASVCVVLIAGVGLGFFVQLRVGEYLNPAIDPRFEHPTTEKELIGLIKKARSQGLQIRVRGSQHSVASAIHTDESGGHINVQLDRYTKILRFDAEKRQVTVQAGCHLGVDPHDPHSTPESSLLNQLDKRGWALPDLGGITHQTVAGFLSTGSSGGTTRFDIGDCVVSMRIIDGTGQVRELQPGNDPAINPFYGAGLSMGLFGVISTVTLQCVQRYDVIGTNITSSVAACEFELYADGERGLGAFLTNQPYSRLLWWPQRGVEKIQVWKGRATTLDDHKKTHVDGVFQAKPLEQIPKVLGSTRVSQVAINRFYDLISRDEPPFEPTTETFVKTVLNGLLPDQSEEFWESWHRALPMDNEVDDDLMPTEFTELYIDLERTGEVMRALRDFYAGDSGMARTGSYACEIYAAPPSKFWMSASHGKAALRVDIFWFKTRIGNPQTDFYPQYWELLRQFDFRFHWGKYLSAPDSSTGVEYRKKNLPLWQEFMKTRAALDPDQVFVSGYWAQHLGLDSPK